MSMMNQCVGCASIAPEEEDSDGVPYECFICRDKYPPALLKAVTDPFDYAAGIEGIGVLEFESATLHGDWVTLDPGDRDRGFHGHEWRETVSKTPFPCPRGIDVRLSSIIWVADAPNGS